MSLYENKYVNNAYFRDMYLINATLHFIGKMFGTLLEICYHLQLKG